MTKVDTSSPEPSRSLISKEKTATYIRSDVKTASGKRRSVDNGDEVAVALRGADRERLRVLATRHGMAARIPGWEKLNDGLFRLCIGNALRQQAVLGTELDLK